MSSSPNKPNPRSSNPLPTKQGYDLWSTSYDDDANPLIALESTLFHDLIGDVRDTDLLDVGCGTGRLTIPLAAAGARVTGIDFSEGMLAQARAKPGADKVRFITHDLHEPFPLPDHAFDVVLCALVLEHIKDLDHLFAEFARLTKPKRASGERGRIVITVMHPAMLLRGVQARFLPEASGKAREGRADVDKLTIDTLPHTIADYVTGALRAGLAIDHIAEHPMTADLAASNPRAERYVGWPMLLTMRLTP